MRDAGDQLPHGRHLLALQELFLCAAQVFISAAGFLVELHLFDCGGQLAADGDQQIFVVAGVVPVFPAGDAHDAYRLVLAPQDDPDPVWQAVGTHELDNRRWKMGQKIVADHFRPRAHHQIAEAFRECDFAHAAARLAARSPTGAPAIGSFRLASQVDRSRFRGEQRDHLAQSEVQDFVEIERLCRDHGQRR